MSLAKSLNLVPDTKPRTVNIVVGRRQRLMAAIDKQITMLKIAADGGEAPYDFPVRKPTPWYWIDEDGHYFVSIKYGKKPVEITKGNYSIRCETMPDVVDALKTVKEHVVLGDLDNQLTVLAQSIRKNFGR